MIKIDYATITSFARATIPLFLVAVSWFFQIIQKQDKQSQKESSVEKMLKPGVTIFTIDGRSGIVLQILEKTLIVELSDGEKTELFKQTIDVVKYE
jgi:preprotein translocase YajC subunit